MCLCNKRNKIKPDNIKKYFTNLDFCNLIDEYFRFNNIKTTTKFDYSLIKMTVKLIKHYNLQDIDVYYIYISKTFQHYYKKSLELTEIKNYSKFIIF
jgi:hypothetical protein